MEEEGPFLFEAPLLTYCYGYNPETRRGPLYLGPDHKSQLPICQIYVLSNIVDESQYEVEAVSHPHLLNCLFVNRKEGHIVFEAPMIELRKMKEDWINNSTDATQRRAVLWPYAIPGKKAGTGKMSSFLIPDYRIYIRQLYKLVIDLHRLNFTLTSLTIEHLWIGGDRALKVCGIGLIASRTEPTLKNDFELVISVMKDIISPRGQLPYPPAIDDLIIQTRALKCKVLENGTLEDDGALLLHHLALVPPSDTLAFIKALRDKLTVSSRDSYLVDEAKRKLCCKVGDILDDMPNCKEWELRFVGLERVENCYNFNPHENTKQTTRRVTADDRKKALLKFIRNMAVHIVNLDHALLETTILALYSKEIFAVHASLMKWGALSAFMK